MQRSFPWVLAAAIIAIGAVFWLRAGRSHDASGAAATAPAPAATMQRDTAARTGPEPAVTPPAAQARLPAEKTSQAASTDDPFEFIRSRARRAFDGDAEAQYRIARALDKCWVTLSLLRKEADPETAIWSRGANWSPMMKEWAISEYRRCKRLLTEDPFAELPKRDGGYDVKYWQQRALESGHPMAVSSDVLSKLSDLRAGAAMPKPVDRATAIDALSSAALSGQPDVLLKMGFDLWMRQNPELATRGAAFMLAACRAGANCGYDSDVFPFEMCYHSGNLECGPGVLVEDILNRAAQPAEFARAYAESQQIEQALRAGDVQGFRTWLDVF